MAKASVQARSGSSAQGRIEEFPLDNLSLLLDQISTTAWVAGCSDAAEDDLRKMMFVLMDLADKGKAACDRLLEQGGQHLLKPLYQVGGGK